MSQTPQQRLDEVEAALHQLKIGKAVVSIGFGERRLERTPADIPQLERYRSELLAQINGRVRTRNRVSYVIPD